MLPFVTLLHNDHGRECLRAQRAFDRRDMTAFLYHSRVADLAYTQLTLLDPLTCPPPPIKLDDSTKKTTL